MIKSLTPEQKDILDAEGRIVLCACPGSGKTFVVAKKLLKYIQEWKYTHRGVAVLSFTNVASQEIDRQVKEIAKVGERMGDPHFIGTIDSFINNYILLRFGYLIQTDYRKRPVILFENYGEMSLYTKNPECYKRGCVNKPHEFHWSENGLLRANRPIDCAVENPKPCIKSKQTMLKNGYINQREAASLSFLLLKKYPQIVKAIAYRFPVIIVDEAQDTSIEQMAILDLLADAGVTTIILVGDPDQAIYEWRNATTECFINKTRDANWTTKWLTCNFRSSQLICNATHLFSNTLKNSETSHALGEYAAFKVKPILIKYDMGLDNKVSLTAKFKKLCYDNAIDYNPENVAILTRSRIHTGTDISGLWKSPEIKTLAKATYEWYLGSRREAFTLCEKVMYSLCVGKADKLHTEIKVAIELTMPYELWKRKVIHLLTTLPSPELSIVNWSKILLEKIISLLDIGMIKIRDDVDLLTKIKIKSRDKANPNFKEISLRNYIEKKSNDLVTISSVHGVKGESYDAVLLVIEKASGNTLTLRALETKSLNDELIRIAYVAMTRPRKLLVVAVPRGDNDKILKRFPKEIWDYL